MTLTINSRVGHSVGRVLHRTVRVRGVDVFYREAGREDAPVILLLHGFPSSSHMFRNLIPALADEFRLIAPDYPGFGHSAAPSVNEFEYTFDNLADVIEGFTDALGLKAYVMYVQDYGAPVGYRLAVKHPERVKGLIVQNGNAYEEGLDNEFWQPLKAYWKDPSEETAAPLRAFFTPDATKWQYTHGARNPEALSPDAWVFDQALLDRPGNHDIQLALFRDYGTNPARYPSWHAFFRAHQPPTLVAWGRNDPIFPAAGAMPYKRDLETLEFHLLETGHFALEEEGDRIAALIRHFVRKHVFGDFRVNCSTPDERNPS